ncbi:hypothetical protein [Infirmifilum sp.]|uniref:hypothetical protein n=1 Tax=Infirmifilum sp. TaxID=2856575 RepID=UPI003D0A4B63
MGVLKRKIKRHEELLALARELDIHYVPSRYPNAHPAVQPSCQDTPFKFLKQELNTLH